MTREYTLRSIAQDLNVVKKTVENAHDRLKAKNGDMPLGEIIGGVRYFNELERSQLLSEISAARRKTAKETSEPLDNAIVLSESAIVSNVAVVNPLAVDLDSLEMKVNQLVEFGLEKISEQDEQNKLNTVKAIETEKKIANKLNELKQAQNVAVTRQQVYSVLQETSADTTKKLLQELQSMIS